MNFPIRFAVFEQHVMCFCIWMIRYAVVGRWHSGFIFLLGCLTTEASQWLVVFSFLVFLIRKKGRFWNLYLCCCMLNIKKLHFSLMQVSSNRVAWFWENLTLRYLLVTYVYCNSNTISTDDLNIHLERMYNWCVCA